MPLRENGDFALIISVLATEPAAAIEKYPARACQAWLSPPAACRLPQININKNKALKTSRLDASATADDAPAWMHMLCRCRMTGDICKSLRELPYQPMLNFPARTVGNTRTDEP
jgi:hypothetical protein